MPMTYDNHTPKGRAALDAAVAKRLGKRGQTRGDIAEALPGSTPRMVSAALLRLVSAGKAAREGSRNAPTYSKAVTS